MTRLHRRSSASWYPYWKSTLFSQAASVSISQPSRALELILTKLCIRIISSSVVGTWPAYNGRSTIPGNPARVLEQAKAKRTKAIHTILPRSQCLSAFPSDATFVPSFHSCLISRVYALEIRLGLQDSGPLSRALHLSMPIQVSRGSHSQLPGYTEATYRNDRTASVGEDECAQLFSQYANGDGHDNVVNHGHFSARADALPLYSR